MWANSYRRRGGCSHQPTICWTVFKASMCFNHWPCLLTPNTSSSLIRRKNINFIIYLTPSRGELAVHPPAAVASGTVHNVRRHRTPHFSLWWVRDSVSTTAKLKPTNCFIPPLGTVKLGRSMKRKAPHHVCVTARKWKLVLSRLHLSLTVYAQQSNPYDRGSSAVFQPLFLNSLTVERKQPLQPQGAEVRSRDRLTGAVAGLWVEGCPLSGERCLIFEPGRKVSRNRYDRFLVSLRCFIERVHHYTNISLLMQEGRPGAFWKWKELASYRLPTGVRTWKFLQRSVWDESSYRLNVTYIDKVNQEWKWESAAISTFEMKRVSKTNAVLYWFLYFETETSVRWTWPCWT